MHDLHLPTVALFLAALLLITGCDQRNSPAGAVSGPQKVTLQLNWQPEPEFGGFYAAAQNGSFKSHGLDVTVTPGNVGTPTVQMIGSGSVESGIVSADELVIARSKGNPVVALLAIYQDCPQGIMTHAGRGFKTIADVFSQPGTLAIENGLPYSDFLKNKYGFDKLKVVPSPGGDVTVFLKDPQFSQQCFITSEPLVARQQGGDPKTFLVADAGYNPYTTVLATRDDYAKAHPDIVKQMVAACREGWNAYLADPKPTNAFMHGLNPSMDEATFAAAADAQKPLIQNASIKAEALGAMSADRWKTLVDQLVQLKAIDKPVDPGACYWPDGK